MLKIALKYGALMGGLMLVYIVLEWSYLASPDLRSVAIFGVALLFTVLGVWGGLKLSNRRSYPAPPKPLVHPEQFDIRPRELEILELMSKGLSNQEIADRLHISLSTVKTHNMNLYVKLDVKRRTQAISKAKELRLLDD